MSQKIAFIDDEIGVLESIKWVLKNEPYQLYTFQNPIDALDNLEKNEFAVVVSDQVMPVMEGISLLRHVKTRHPTTECMIMTAHYDTDKVKETTDYIIKKPWDIEEFKSIVKKAVNRYEENLRKSMKTSTVDKCILYVENDDLLMDVMDKMLSLQGYKVIVTSQCSEAIRLLQSKPEMLDLVITDMKMPDMDGLELSRKLLEIRPNLPIIICTGFQGLIDKESMKSIGIKEIILKPFLIDELITTIRKTFNESEETGNTDT